MNEAASIALKQPVNAPQLPSGVLQRKCDCGQHTIGGGACTECRKNPPTLQRATRNSDGKAQIGGEVPRLNGQPLDAPERASLELRFAHDFSQVRVYPKANLPRTERNARHAIVEAPSMKSRSGEARDLNSDYKFSSDIDQKPEPAPGPSAPEERRENLPPPGNAQPLQGDSGAKPKPAPAPAPVPATKIVSKTVATTPADRARKKIGIGEEVTVSTDPATAAAWTVAGGGSVAPAAGNSTTFTASKSPSKSTVKATVGAKHLSIDFEVIAPNGITSKVSSNAGMGTPGPPNNQIGFKTLFDCLVLPATVSFNRVEFRENIPKDSWKWPDGTAESNGPKIEPWNVGEDNKTTDSVSSGPRSIARLWDGKKNVDLSFTIRVPEDYKDETGSWVPWLPNEAHYKEYAGATQKGRGTLKATNDETGSWQGPWK